MTKHNPIKRLFVQKRRFGNSRKSKESSDDICLTGYVVYFASSWSMIFLKASIGWAPTN